MAIFRKLITTPNVYRIKTPKGVRIRAVTQELLNEMAETSQNMLDAGIKIPAPFAHKDEDGIVPSPTTEDGETDVQTKQKKLWSSDINAGFWTKFETTNEGLVGYVEVPDKLADKIGTTIQETSVFMEPTFEDGLGRSWKNALRHVALVTNAVEPNQKNFELVDLSPEYSLSMSFSMSDAVGEDKKPSPPKSGDSSQGSDTSAKSSSETADTSDEKNSSDDSNDNDKDKIGTGNIPEIVALLKEKLDYELPSDTTPENFLDRLRVLLTSIKKDEEEDEQDFKQNPKSKEKPGGDDSEVRSSPVAMSNQDNKDNIVVLEKKLPKLLEKLLATVKETLTTRVQAALEAGKIGKKTATQMFTEVNALVMSLDDLDEEGEFKKSKIEEKLEMAEDLSGFAGDETNDKTLPNGSFIPNMPDANLPSMTKDELEAVLNSI
jgi:hypothetical protein